MTPDPGHNEITSRVIANASEQEREALLLWLVQLLQIRDSSLSVPQKARRALSVTATSRVVWPLVKLLAVEAKRVGWDERSAKGRGGLIGISAGLAFFGGQGAGIAALGGAIGVPLWLVLGAGGALLGHWIHDLEKRVPPERRPMVKDAEHTIIDVEAKRRD